MKHKPSTLAFFFCQGHMFSFVLHYWGFQHQPQAPALLIVRN